MIIKDYGTIYDVSLTDRNADPRPRHFTETPMRGICDFKVPIPDDLKPAGLRIYQETPFALPSPPPMVVYAESPKGAPSAFDKVNLRRLFLMLWDSRTPIASLKISRRSRRRWRGKGGVWQFDPKLWELFKEAVIKCNFEDKENA
jgi:hypothetical protein